MAVSPVKEKAYEEIVGFMAAGVTPESLIEFRPSETARKRIDDLIYREKTTGLSQDERSELDHYMQLEHLMTLAKARARRHLHDG